jgi:hypothetical protein
MKSVFFMTATIMLSSSAAADTVSLLKGLLADAPALSASLTNVAQNLGMVDGAFALETERHLAAVAAALEDWSVGRALNAAGLGNRVTEVQLDELRILAPLSANVGQTITTAVGSIQSADLTALFDASGSVERVSAQAGAASVLVEAQAGVARLAALQNVSFNSGRIEGDANLLLRDVSLRADGIITTAIGALQNGALSTTVDLDATVRGQIGAVSDTTALLIAAMVGT